MEQCTPASLSYLWSKPSTNKMQSSTYGWMINEEWDIRICYKVGVKERKQKASLWLLTEFCDSSKCENSFMKLKEKIIRHQWSSQGWSSSTHSSWRCFRRVPGIKSSACLAELGSSRSFTKGKHKISRCVTRGFIKRLKIFYNFEGVRSRLF